MAWRRPRPNQVLVVVALVAWATLIASCASSTQAGQARQAQSAGQIRADQARAIAQQAGLGPDVQAFLARAAAASDVTYTVVYSQGGGQSTTVMARPPDRRIDVVGASGPGSTDRIVIRDTDTYVCHLDASRWACVSGVTSAPGGPFTPDAITTTISDLVQLSPTYEFAVASRPMLGLDASCLSATRRSGAPPAASVGDHGVICIAPSGVILRVEDSGTPLQATSYRPSVPSGAFDLPARPTPALTTTSTPSP